MKIERDNYTLYLGDCLDVMPELEQVDAVITSPPYNFGGFSRNGRKSTYTKYKDDRPEDEYKSWIGNVISACANSTKDGGVIYWNHKGKFNNWVYEHPYWVIELCPVQLFQTIVWNYPSSPDVAKVKWYPRKEYIFMFSKGKPKYFNEEMAQLTDIWKITHDFNNKHPAPFPVEIPLRAAGASTKDNDTILDPFMGSGTTGVACAQLGRKFIGIEIDPDYFEIARKRIETAYAQKVMF